VSRSSEQSEEEILPLHFLPAVRTQGQSDRKRRAQGFGSGQEPSPPSKGGGILYEIVRKTSYSVFLS